MECLHFTLSAYLEENGVPDSSISYNVLSDVALGLHYLHTQPLPIVHGDLSAESILLSSALQAKISGIKVSPTFSNTPACRSHAVQIRSSLKSCYLPPEARNGCLSYNTSFDPFSFGVLIIHTLSARWPVPTGTDPNSSATQFNQRAEYIKDIGLTARMREMVRKCLQDSPDARPSMSTIVKEVHLIMVRSGCISLMGRWSTKARNKKEGLSVPKITFEDDHHYKWKKYAFKNQRMTNLTHYYNIF